MFLCFNQFILLRQEYYRKLHLWPAISSATKASANLSVLLASFGPAMFVSQHKVDIDQMPQDAADQLHHCLSTTFWAWQNSFHADSLLLTHHLNQSGHIEKRKGPQILEPISQQGRNFMDWIVELQHKKCLHSSHKDLLTTVCSTFRKEASFVGC